MKSKKWKKSTELNIKWQVEFLNIDSPDIGKHNGDERVVFRNLPADNYIQAVERARAELTTNGKWEVIAVSAKDILLEVF